MINKILKLLATPFVFIGASVVGIIFFACDNIIVGPYYYITKGYIPEEPILMTYLVEKVAGFYGYDIYEEDDVEYGIIDGE